MHRREFLKLAGMSAGSFAATPFLGAAERFIAPVPSRAAKKVAVIGAGLAGLSAAYELHKMGHDVTVLEAQLRPGGRVLTLRQGFADGLYAEAGGEWIHPILHQHVLRYAEEFGLELKPVYGNEAYWLEGRFVKSEEVRRDQEGLAKLRATLKKHFDGVKIAEPPANSPGRELDKIDYLSFLQKIGIDQKTQEIERMRVRATMTADPEEISTLNMAYEYALFPFEEGEVEDLRIVGGNDQLPIALAQRLGERVWYGRPVVAIVHDDRGVEIRYKQNDSAAMNFEDGRQRPPVAREGRLAADHVIVAIPAPCVPDLHFQPALPAEMAQAIRATQLGRMVKTVFQARQRFWEKQLSALGGLESVYTGLEVGYVYHASQNQPGPRGLLACYSGGRSADALGKLDNGARLRRARQAIRSLWPLSKEWLENGASYFWNADKWSRGSYAYFSPGQMVGVRHLLRQSVGRIHFAGEHTANWQGYMHGAIESGNRAAKEIDQTISCLPCHVDR